MNGWRWRARCICPMVFDSPSANKPIAYVAGLWFAGTYTSLPCPSSQEVPKAMDGALGNLIWCGATSPMARAGIGSLPTQDMLRVPFLSCSHTIKRAFLTVPVENKGRISPVVSMSMGLSEKQQTDLKLSSGKPCSAPTRFPMENWVVSNLYGKLHVETHRPRLEWTSHLMVLCFSSRF